MKYCEISVFYFILKKKKKSKSRLEKLHLLPNDVLNVALLDILLL